MARIPRRRLAVILACVFGASLIGCVKGAPNPPPPSPSVSHAPCRPPKSGVKVGCFSLGLGHQYHWKQSRQPGGDLQLSIGLPTVSNLLPTQSDQSEADLNEALHIHSAKDVGPLYRQYLGAMKDGTEDVGSLPVKDTLGHITTRTVAQLTAPGDVVTVFKVVVDKRHPESSQLTAVVARDPDHDGYVAIGQVLMINFESSNDAVLLPPLKSELLVMGAVLQAIQAGAAY
jgi:hypothetical protein